MPEFKIRVIQHIVESKIVWVEAASLEAALSLNPDDFADDIGHDDFVQLEDRCEDRWIEEF
jgi:hypothetical protein|tara:strand:+ start:98 stop:280 length:183 start_codon:yes stop_codon:yes gene_type:complete